MGGHPGRRSVGYIRPCHTLRCCVSMMGRRKAPRPAMQQNRMRCSFMQIPTHSIFVPDFVISQLFILRFSNSFHHNNGHLDSRL